MAIEKKTDMTQNHRLLQDIMDYSPSLIVTHEDIDEIVRRLRRSLEEVQAEVLSSAAPVTAGPAGA